MAFYISVFLGEWFHLIWLFLGFVNCRLPHEWCQPFQDGDDMMKTDKSLPR